MCGIAIVAGASASQRVCLDAMLAAQRHRGPDAESVETYPHVGFAHGRLAIIDLSPGAAQPMVTPDGNLTLVFNGEIYNYRELRQELAGYPFRTQSDVEVLLAAFERWGEACLDRLNGMFAFAVWNARQRSLFAARDRFGVKPLYYAEGPGGTLLLSSEIRALHAAGVARQPDPAAWATYFTYGMYDHGPSTFWSGIHRVLPGGTLRWAPDSSPRLGQWYDVAQRVLTAGADERPVDAVADELLALLEDTVRLRFRADVPVGICLSGGVDSSLLLGLVARTHPDVSLVKAFTFYTNDPAYDERPWVERQLAGSRHPWIATELRVNEVPALSGMVQSHQDEPWGGLPTLGMATVHRAARDAGVVVLLDGNGLDEAWGGYDYYARAEQQSLARGPVQASAPAEAPRWLRDDFAALAEAPAIAPPFPDAMRNVQYRDLRFAKIPRGMRFADRVSMMYSRELREPFLDHRIVELGLRQPADRKVREGQGKWLVRDLAIRAGLIDPAVAAAPKRPVQTPQREWLRGPLSAWASAQIDAALAGWGSAWLDAAKVRSAWDTYRSSEQDSSFVVWQWVSLGLAQDEPHSLGTGRP